MRKISLMMVLFGLLAVVAACGGGDGGGGGAGKAAAEASIAGFENIFNDTKACFAGGATTCDCSGGGTASVVAGGFAVENCKDAATGLVYNGSLSVTATGVGTFDFSTFGECTNVTGTAIVGVGVCSGDVGGTCAGEATSCNVVDGTGEYCVCE